MILSPGPTLVVDQGMEGGPAVPGAGCERLEDVERAHIEAVLAACQWQLKGAGQAAERLGLNPSTLWSRMKKLGITRPQP